ncbi:MAG: hypothetical protein Q9217_002798 [Psora testacea]
MFRYIGGDVLYELTHAHPDFEYTCLVRNSDKGSQVASQYAKARLVYGGLDDVKILEDEAKKADIVLSNKELNKLDCANSDHEAAAKALVSGLLTREDGDCPGCLIHTSGTGILLYKDMERKTFGEASTKIYNDWDGIAEVTSLPEFAPHRIVDKIILDADGPNLKTAIVCPPTIYGVGRGPGNQRGHQLYELARCTLQKKQGLKIGAGENFWPNVHIHDMSKVYLKLLEAAAEGESKATWGNEGYYFTENGEHIWGEVSKAVASAAYKQGLIPSDEVVTISNEEADQITMWGSVTWGANSRCRAIRARRLLDWSPRERSLEHEVPDAVSEEAQRLGMTLGHTTQVTRLKS